VGYPDCGGCAALSFHNSDFALAVAEVAVVVGEYANVCNVMLIGYVEGELAVCSTEVAYGRSLSVDMEGDIPLPVFARCFGECAVMETQRGATTAIELSGEANNFVVTYDYAGNIAVYLWNGSTLSPVQVDPNPQPVGNYSDAYIYSYGLNLTQKRWLFFESNAPMTAVYEGEEAPNGESIAAAGYDANNGVVYALENSGKLYRYSGINPQSGKLTGRTQVATVAGADGINEMAFNNADGQLYGNQRCGKPDDC